MFYGVYRDDWCICGGFYEDDYRDWFSDTFSPDTDTLLMIDLHVHGKTYAERKGDMIEKAHDFQDLFSVYGVSISWGELAIFGDFFEKYGKRYGLLTEFRENGIL